LAYSRIVRIGDGITNIFAVDFPLGQLSEDDITARVGTEVDGTGSPAYRTITFLGSSLLKISGSVPRLGTQVVFERTTERDNLAVKFRDGDVMDEDNLDIGLRQAILLLHEVLDGRLKMAVDLSMNGYKLTNLPAPTNSTDATTKAYVDHLIEVVVAGEGALNLVGTLREWSSRHSYDYYTIEEVKNGFQPFSPALLAMANVSPRAAGLEVLTKQTPQEIAEYIGTSEAQDIVLIQMATAYIDSQTRYIDAFAFS
jgi:hypothetical protein